MTIDFIFAIGELVSHVADKAALGVVVAVMQRGGSRSYEVQWGVEKCIWHIECELLTIPTLTPEIGYHGH